ncbi:hypothetical protein [Stenotrophomonas koreensis]|uniref:hypothetical protein n=1 Tax=Stenotrophomonas koreensis TaxID=266128 RepID=UPI00070FF90D|nr:hypothetical protein [Stenotrophomonas koreensis]
MRQQPINLIGGFYADESRHWSVQDTCNWLPVVAEQAGTLTPAKLATPPGLRPYQQIGTGPIRGMHDCEGQRFVVSGRTLYRITNTGVGIPLGTIPGVGRVSISHNQFGGGNQVLVCNGAPGGGYVYDTRAQTFERITDPGFPGSLQTAYIDSYLLGVEPAGRFWFHSNLADATDYNTLDRYEAEAAPDRIVGLAVSQFEVIVFGERTAEFYGNAGGATGTFQSKRAVIDRGCASRNTICNLDNSVFWLGDDGIVYRLEGYAARRVSTVPLERALAGLRWQDAFAFAWEDRGHKCYYLTFPDGQTWGYDVVCGLWHRRESYGLSRWRLNDAVRWGNAWFGGDFQNGRIWQLDWDYQAEGDQPMVSERTSPVMADNQSAFIAASVELIMGVGQQPAVISGEFPEQPNGPTITGSAPTGSAGWPYPGYSYNVTAGDAPVGSVRITDGRLPNGLSWDNGVIESGDPLESGDFPIAVRATDGNGLWAEIRDIVRISPVLYVLASSAVEGLWISRDLIEWSSMYPLVPSAGNSVSSVHSVPGGLILDVVSRGQGDVQKIVRTEAPPWGAYVPVTATTVVESKTGLLPDHFCISGSVVVAWDSAGAYGSYHLSSDGGETFDEIATPLGRIPCGMARMNSGRWIAHFQSGPSQNLYYSDEDSPTAWTPVAASGGNFATQNGVAAGEYGYMVDSIRRVWRTEDGESWSQVGIISPANPASPQLKVLSNGNVLAYGQNGYGTVALSVDNGVTWQSVAISGADNMIEVSEAAGRVVGSSGASKFWVSDDFGQSWDEYAPPFSGYGNAASITILELQHD